MNFLKTINGVAKVMLFLAVCTTAINTYSQDKLASLAPSEKRMRSIDSLSLVRMLGREMFDASTLYPTWDNKYTTNYGIALPSEYRIDLRNFHMPCDSRLVTSHYGYRASFRRNHYGTDIKVYVGDTIRAAFNGKVRIVAYNGRGYGKYVIIRHSNGLETVYGHMSRQLVEENQTVKAGEPIGLGGNTGRSTGSHLHFETRFLGQFIDPEVLFDFEACDVKGDAYVFRSNSNAERVTASLENSGGESEELTPAEMAAAELKAEQKKEESSNFQNERRTALRKGGVHKVKKGDSLYSIARKYNTSVDELCRMNNISAKSTLHLGQILKHK